LGLGWWYAKKTPFLGEQLNGKAALSNMLDRSSEPNHDRGGRKRRRGQFPAVFRPASGFLEDASIGGELSRRHFLAVWVVVNHSVWLATEDSDESKR
jgi:hypothetical protein